MTIPTQMNCAHQGDGWCLDCVGELEAKRADAEEALRRMQELPKYLPGERALDVQRNFTVVTIEASHMVLYANPIYRNYRVRSHGYRVGKGKDCPLFLAPQYLAHRVEGELKPFTFDVKDNAIVKEST